MCSVRHTNKTRPLLHINLLIKYSVQQQILFNGNVFRNNAVVVTRVHCISFTRTRPSPDRSILDARTIIRIWAISCKQIHVNKKWVIYCNPSISILYKSKAGRYRYVRVADGSITACYRFIKNASWDIYADLWPWYKIYTVKILIAPPQVWIGRLIKAFVVGIWYNGPILTLNVKHYLQQYEVLIFRLRMHGLVRAFILPYNKMYRIKHNYWATLTLCYICHKKMTKSIHFTTSWCVKIQLDE